jgi:hypothetical protein
VTLIEAGFYLLNSTGVVEQTGYDSAQLGKFIGKLSAPFKIGKGVSIFKSLGFINGSLRRGTYDRSLYLSMVLHASPY